MFKHKFKVDCDAKSASYDIILGCNAMQAIWFSLQWKCTQDSDLSKKLKLIASLMASGCFCTINKYTFKLDSLQLKRQKKNSLKNDTLAKNSIKQQIFTNAYLLIYHHKKRRNSMTYSTNIDSFSKAPLDS
jgi:hypothetical protein